MIKRLFDHKREISRLDERIVWGIWAPRRLQLAYKLTAVDLRVPISVLVGHVLRQWLAQYYETVLKDKNKKLEFADYLARKYLSNQPED